MTAAALNRDRAEELRNLSRDVRRIGNGYRSNPEAIAVQKDLVAKRLTRLATEIERDI